MKFSVVGRTRGRSWALCLLLALPVSASAQVDCLSGFDLLVALPNTAAFAQGTVQSPDIVRAAPGFGSQAVPGWPVGVGVLAFTQQADGTVMLVPDRAFMLGGNLYQRGQLLAVLNGQISIVNFYPHLLDLRAIDYHDNRYFFVLEGYLDLAFEEIQLGPRTVIVPQVDANGDPTGLVDVLHDVGQPGDLPRNVRINGLAVIDDDHWLLTFDRGFSIQGEYYGRSDVILYRVQSRTFERALALADLDPRWETLAPVDISLRARVDQIFRDRFQTGGDPDQAPEGVGSCS